MILSQILMQAANANLLLGFIPESLGLLFFGIILIVSTIILRGVFKHWEVEEEVKIQNSEKLSKLKTERNYPNEILESGENRGVLRK